MRSICYALKLLQVIFSMIKVALEQFRDPKRHTTKRELMTPKSTLSMWSPVRIVYKDNFKNFFQMTMLFVAYIELFQDSYILREATSSQQTLLQSRYFSRVTSSTQHLLIQNSCFFRAATFWGQLLFQNNHSFSAIILSKQLLIRTNKLLPINYFLRIGSSSGQLVFQNSYYLGRQICLEY